MGCGGSKEMVEEEPVQEFDQICNHLDPAEVVKQAMALPKNAAVVKVRKERTTLLQTYRGPKV